ncbi:transglycosylase SLT domain-containing protein [Streptomyces sp. Tue 6430]|nr:transglycosylase SLT domain-containing protein [Streptomyces sp. Tue 6430]
MPKNTRKIAMAGVATLGAAAVAFTVVPADGQTTTTDSLSSSHVAYSSERVHDVKASVTDLQAGADLKVEAIEARKKAAADAVAAKKAATTAAAQKKTAAAAAAKKAAAKKAAAARAAKAAANRSAQRPVVKQVAVKSYPNNLDGWIREALGIMKKKGIPGSYHGLHKNIMRESSGNPKAINDWDINAINGIPSKGLLQVIPPTFSAYHVPGTSWNIYDPVANITAAANYAADRYGTIDNVNSAY